MSTRSTRLDDLLAPIADPARTSLTASAKELALLVDGGWKVERDALLRETSRLVDDYLPKKLFDSELVKL